MHHMRKATVRDLRYDFPKVEAWIAAGEPIEITKRGRVIAQLVPPAAPAGKRKQPPWPDFLARLRRNFGNRVLSTTGAKLLAQERERF